MSRTIKFRGKRFDNGQWAYGNLIIDDSGNCEIVDYESNREIRCDVRGETIGQFTGLYDFIGHEIYEGDIMCETETGIFVEVAYDAPEFCYKDNDFGYKFLNHLENFKVIGNIHDKLDPAEKKADGYTGVALFGYPFLFHNGDLGFHEKMEELCLTRGSTILCGLPNMCILANKREYLLTDYDKEEDFCGQFKLKATYSVEDFIQGIKEFKSE